MNESHNAHEASVTIRTLQNIAKELYLIQNWTEDMFEYRPGKGEDIINEDIAKIKQAIGGKSYETITALVDEIRSITVGIELAMRSEYSDMF
jgi:hypothetical protein